MCCVRAELCFPPLLPRHKAGSTADPQLRHGWMRGCMDGRTDKCTWRETGKASKPATPSLPFSPGIPWWNPIAALCHSPVHGSPPSLSSMDGLSVTSGWDALGHTGGNPGLSWQPRRESQGFMKPCWWGASQHSPHSGRRPRSKPSPSWEPRLSAREPLSTCPMPF